MSDKARICPKCGQEYDNASFGHSYDAIEEFGRCTECLGYCPYCKPCSSCGEDVGLQDGLTTAGGAWLCPDCQNGRILGTFIKQEWGGHKGGTAIEVETVSFDATAAVLSMSLTEITELSDNDDSSDTLGRSAVGWCGPCEVEIEESILRFFGVGSKTDITEEMLAAKQEKYRSVLDSQAPPTVKRRLVIDVEYDLNGENIDTLEGLLEQIATGASNRGLLSGDTMATVESWSYKVEVIQ